MQEKQSIRSPYLSALKTKDGSFFPKIHRPEVSSGARFLAKSLRKKNNPESIFKPCEQKPLKSQQLQYEQIIQSQCYKQLQSQIIQAQLKFKQELAEIQQKKKQTEAQAKLYAKDSYQHKYELWELRNQIIQMENLLKDEEVDYSRMLYQMGYALSDGEEVEEDQNHLVE